MAGYQYDADTDSRDRSLWNRLIKGDKSALGLLFDFYAINLFSYGFQICGEREIVKDIIQDIFVELWTCHPRLSPNVKVKFYLYRCVVTDNRRISDALSPRLPSVTIAYPTDGTVFRVGQEVPVEVSAIFPDTIKKYIVVLQLNENNILPAPGGGLK